MVLIHCSVFKDYYSPVEAGNLICDVTTLIGSIQILMSLMFLLVEDRLIRA